MKAEGIGGELRCGYQVAAQLAAWELLDANPGWRVQAVYASQNEYWLTQRPLTLTLVIGGYTWTWDGVEPESDGSIVVDSPPREGVRSVGTESVRQA